MKKLTLPRLKSWGCQYAGAKSTSLMYARLAYEEDKGDLRLKDNLEKLEKELNEPTNN